MFFKKHIMRAIRDVIKWEQEAIEKKRAGEENFNNRKRLGKIIPKWKKNVYLENRKCQWY